MASMAWRHRRAPGETQAAPCGGVVIVHRLAHSRPRRPCGDDYGQERVSIRRPRAARSLATGLPLVARGGCVADDAVDHASRIAVLVATWWWRIASTPSRPAAVESHRYRARRRRLGGLVDPRGTCRASDVLPPSSSSPALEAVTSRMLEGVGRVFHSAGQCASPAQRHSQRSLSGPASVSHSAGQPNPDRRAPCRAAADRPVRRHVVTALPVERHTSVCQWPRLVELAHGTGRPTAPGRSRRLPAAADRQQGYGDRLQRYGHHPVDDAELHTRTFDRRRTGGDQ